MRFSSIQLVEISQRIPKLLFCIRVSSKSDTINSPDDEAEILEEPGHQQPWYSLPRGRISTIRVIWVSIKNMYMRLFLVEIIPSVKGLKSSIYLFDLPFVASSQCLNDTNDTPPFLILLQSYRRKDGSILMNKTYMVSYKIVLDNGHASARASQQPLTLAGTATHIWFTELSRYWLR